MKAGLAKVSKLPDSESDKLKLVIYFTIKDVIEDCIAYPIDVYTECEVGDEIIVYEIESALGVSYLYNKLRLKDITELKLGNSSIIIEKDNIIIETPNSKFELKSDGTINLSTIPGVMININGGTVIPDPSKLGPFCALPTCVYSGVPHVGNKLNTL